MKPREFCENSTAIIMNRLTDNLKIINTKAKLRIELSRYNTNINISINGNLLKINIYQKGNISYKIWDSLGETTEDYICFYEYVMDDNHEKVLKKLENDMGRLIYLFFKTGSFHAIVNLDIRANKDNEKELAEYCMLAE